MDVRLHQHHVPPQQHRLQLHAHMADHRQQHYAHDQQQQQQTDSDDAHSVRSDDDPPLPLQEHDVDRPIELPPPSSSSSTSHRQHSSHTSHHQHHMHHQHHPRQHPQRRTDTITAYTTSSSDDDDDDGLSTTSGDSKPASSASESLSSYPHHQHTQQRMNTHATTALNLQPSSVLALTASRKHAAAAAASPYKSNASTTAAAPLLRRPNSASSLLPSPLRSPLPSTATNAALERKRSTAGAASAASSRFAGAAAHDDRSVFARIYFEQHHFTSSTVFKLFSQTTVLDVRQSIASKIKLPSSDFAFYVIVVVFPSESSATSARTLRDDELMLPLVERLNNRSRSNTVESDEALGTIRPKPKHRTPPTVKFILKDVRSAPLDLDEPEKRAPVEVQALHFPVLVGKGVHSGYLQKASVKDPNVWRKRWFVVKGDQLLYSKSSTNPREVTSVSLLNAYLAKARPELRIAHAFELRTPRRVYQLCAYTKEEYVAWVHALHVQISISGDNHRLYEAEIMITEDAVARSEDESYRSRYAEPSLLQRIVAREDTLKVFRDFVYNTPAQVLLDTWIECELFRRACIARETAMAAATLNGGGSGSNRATRRSAKDEWDHLRVIIEAAQTLSVIESDEISYLRQSFVRSEQISRRLSLAMHSTDASAAALSSMEFPRVELIAPIHQKIFHAIECGPFQQFIMADGYRQVLTLMIGRIA